MGPRVTFGYGRGFLSSVPGLSLVMVEGFVICPRVKFGYGRGFLSSVPGLSLAMVEGFC